MEKSKYSGVRVLFVVMCDSPCLSWPKKVAKQGQSLTEVKSSLLSICISRRYVK
jgi:hypothetical protein